MQKDFTASPFRRTGYVRYSIRFMIGLTTALVGSADMLSAIVPKLNWSILLGAWPIANHRVPAQTFIVVIGFFLIMLSYGLARGKRHARWIALMLLVLSALLHIRRSGSVLATVVALLLAMILFLLSHFFQARSDPPSAKRGYIALVLGLGIVVFYTIGGFIVLYDDFAPWFDRIGVDGVMLSLLAHAPLHVSRATPAFFFQRALPLLSISAVLYGMIQIFRPVAAAFLPATEERQKVSELTQLYGKNSISYFALGEDKTYFFSTADTAVISYVLVGSTAVVAGDPIGPDDKIPDVITQFIDFCREQDWTIVFWQVRDEIAQIYRRAGFQLLKIGEDAVVDPQTFTLKGGAMANVRGEVKRAEKAGLRVVIYHGYVTDNEQRAQMEQISRQWLASRKGSEMSFSLGQFDPAGDSEQLYALAVDTNNSVYAFMSFIPIYGRHGWGLDLMRRTDSPAPGTMDLLLVRMIEYLKHNRAEMLSLGLAPMSNTNEENETFFGNSIDFFSHRFGNPGKNRSLFFFKKKFQPTWESRYLVYSGALSLPKIGWALYQAHQTDASLLKTIRKSLIDWRRRQAQHEHTARKLLV